MGFLLDIRLFNYAIMTLYALNIARWAFGGNLWAASYWGCALGLTIVITFGETH